MRKRILSLLLALALILAPMNLALPASAAEYDDIKTTVQKNFQDFVDSLNPGSGIGDAATEVFNHTVFGGGKDLSFDEKSPFTGLLLSANVYGDGLVDALSVAFQSLLTSGETSLTAQGSHVWTKDHTSYSYSSGETVLTSVDNYTGSLNVYDEAMITVARTADSSFTITQEQISDKAIVYNVSIQISSGFDVKLIDDAAVPNQQLLDALKWVKLMQKLGLGGKPFRWVVDADFSVVFPTFCLHSYSDWTSLDADSHMRTCSACGGEETAPHRWDEGQPSGADTVYTCLDCGAVKTHSVQIAGSWETDFVFSAADLGVEAEDIRFRCTLNFTEGGTVTADWTAVELDAIKLYFHQMFVSSYYACAYAAGYTSLEDVENFCLQSTGMSVSKYMMTFLNGYDMKAMFTPAPAGGTYEYKDGQLFWDLKLMEQPSDPSIPNLCTISGDTMTIHLASHGKSDYTMTCHRAD